MVNLPGKLSPLYCDSITVKMAVTFSCKAGLVVISYIKMLNMCIKAFTLDGVAEFDLANYP